MEKPKFETEVSEMIFHALYPYLEDDEGQAYCNAFNRSEADPEIILLAQEILSSYNSN